jgi:hypothetical protein
MEIFAQAPGYVRGIAGNGTPRGNALLKSTRRHSGLLARIHPAQTGKAHEVCVRRVENVSALHREHGKVSVARQITRRAEMRENIAEFREMRVA